MIRFAVAPLRLRALDWLRRSGTRPRFLALAAFLFAGDLKADPRLAWLPVDLTLLTGAILCAVLVRRWLWGARPASGRVPCLLGLWFLTFLPGLWGFNDTPYGLQKVATLFSFSLLAALAPLLLLSCGRDLERMFNALAGFCLAIALGGLLGGTDGARLQAFGAGTIALGRASGLLFAYAALRLLRDPGWAPPSFALLAIAAVAGLFSGSRGPILAALLVTVPLAGRLDRKTLLSAGLLLLVLSASLSLAPSGSLLRLQTFAQGQAGGSEQYRVQALAGAWELLGEAPLGLGWGRFASHVDPEKGLGRQYPHNLLAEVTLEAGWVCGAATLGLLLAAISAAWRRRDRPAGRVAFAGATFYALNGMVSGDLNDNRVLFMFLSAALLLEELP